MNRQYTYTIPTKDGALVVGFFPTLEPSDGIALGSIAMNTLSKEAVKELMQEFAEYLGRMAVTADE